MDMITVKHGRAGVMVLVGFAGDTVREPEQTTEPFANSLFMGCKPQCLHMQMKVGT